MKSESTSSTGRMQAPHCDWHLTDIGHGPMWLRHKKPEDLSGVHTLYDALAFSDAELRGYIAFHEAGHVVAGILLNVAQLEKVLIMTDHGHGEADPVAGVTLWKPGWVAEPWRNAAIMAASGERASHRWLHACGLYTPTRGWAIEVLALNDREKAISEAADLASPLTVGIDRPGDVAWSDVQTAADDFLDRHWNDVRSVAEALARTGHLAGADVQQLLSPSCSSAPRNARINQTITQAEAEPPPQSPPDPRGDSPALPC